jgi:peptidoglycan/LPS O-acetylase OafA/YrhL
VRAERTEQMSRPVGPQYFSKRIPELDGLRGLAIFVVILDHYIGNVPHGTSHRLSSEIGTLLGQGSTGVDLFFVLSGFLIGGILLDSMGSPHYYKTFYLRRFHRIIPIYYAWLLIFGLAWVISKKWSGVFGANFSTATPYWAYFLFLQNYFDGRGLIQGFWLIPTWSLAVEEQFYLVAPPLIRRVSTRRLVYLMLGVILFSFLLRLFLAITYGPDHDNWGIRAAYTWMPARADNLALGVLAAIAWRTESSKKWIESNVARFYTAFFACGVVLAVLMYWLAKPNSFTYVTVGEPLYGLFYVSLMAILLADRTSILAKAFRWSWLRELGKISYCVYLIHDAVHWAVFRWVGHMQPRFTNWSSIGLTLLAFVFSIVISEFSWHYFESPLIRRGHRYSY